MHHPPTSTARIKVKRAPIVGLNQRKVAAFVIGLVFDEPRNVRCDALHVLHQRHWVFEDVYIDALQEIASIRTVLAKKGAIGIVDVPRSERFSLYEFTGDLKPASR